MRLSDHARLTRAGAMLMGVVAIGISSAAAGAKTTPGKYEGWNSIDQVEILGPLVLSEYELLLVAPFDTSGIALPPEGENTHEPTKKILDASNELFFVAFQKRLDKDRPGLEVEVEAVPAASDPSGQATPAADSSDTDTAEPTTHEGSGAPPRTLLLRGKLIKLDPGSKAARYFAGFGAGAAKAQYELELVDQGSDKVLVRFTHEKRAASGAFGGGYEDLLTRAIQEVASDLAKSLKSF